MKDSTNSEFDSLLKMAKGYHKELHRNIRNYSFWGMVWIIALIGFVVADLGLSLSKVELPIWIEVGLFVVQIVAMFGTLHYSHNLARENGKHTAVIRLLAMTKIHEIADEIFGGKSSLSVSFDKDGLNVEVKDKETETTAKSDTETPRNVPIRRGKTSRKSTKKGV